jgi:hypothetical protein
MLPLNVSLMDPLNVSLMDPLNVSLMDPLNVSLTEMLALSLMEPVGSGLSVSLVLGAAGDGEMDVLMLIESLPVGIEGGDKEVEDVGVLELVGVLESEGDAMAGGDAPNDRDAVGVLDVEEPIDIVDVAEADGKPTGLGGGETTEMAHASNEGG